MREKDTLMKKLFSTLFTVAAAGSLGIPASRAATTVQDPGNTIGTGADAWSYLIVEGESFETKSNETEGVGFAKVDNTDTVMSFLGNPVLGPDTTASGNGALWTQTIFSQHIDKATYKVQFAKAGTYYLYMRFTMYENGGNEANYLNEDSFFVPPDFGLDPQTDWPLSDRGGYAEGCCADAGYLFLQEPGSDERVSRSNGDEEGRAFWEGNFHWNALISSQFLDPEAQGEPRNHFKYEVTEEMVGKPLEWTVSYREGGTTIDLFLFSTSPDLEKTYSEADLDGMLVPGANKVTVQDPGNVVGSGADAWSYLVVEGESYSSKANEAADVGFAKVDNTDTVMSFLGNPVLGPSTTASGNGALWTQTIFSQHIDKATYKVQFATPGTYYLYMRFTMFENGGNETHYLNEDSFFVPPDFGLDPQTDWPLSDRGGYAEGCCAGAGYLYLQEPGSDERVNYSGGDEVGRAFWEGNFHWNALISSQFLDPAAQGEPNVHFKYEVTEEMVGKPLEWTVSYREGGTTIDLFLFSTSPDLEKNYSEADLDRLLIAPADDVTVQDPGNVVGTGDTAWSYLVLEGEDYDVKSNEAADVGFAKVDNTDTVMSFLGNPVLGADTTASGNGALWTQTIFSQHIDKVTYKVQFATAGTYYLYMRFTMFENGGNETHYLNEDSFFVPPDFGLDPQTDWPLSDRGGYAEGCCAGAGYLYVQEPGSDERVNYSGGDEVGRAFWEGNFHWNALISSQFLDPAAQGNRMCISSTR